MAAIYVATSDASARISLRRADYKRRAEVGEPLYERILVTHHAALIWALAEELLADYPVDVGQCRMCDGAGTWVLTSAITSSPPHSGPGRLVGLCAPCFGTGRERREVGRLLLDALPRPCAPCRGSGWTPASPSSGVTECWRCSGDKTEPGDPASIEALLVLSDQLQPDLNRRADGPPRNHDLEALGISIALLLAGPVAAADPRMADQLAADIERLERFTLAREAQEL